jgi:hypothetical protein
MFENRRWMNVVGMCVVMGFGVERLVLQPEI